MQPSDCSGSMLQHSEEVLSEVCSGNWCGICLALVHEPRRPRKDSEGPSEWAKVKANGLLPVACAGSREHPQRSCDANPSAAKMLHCAHGGMSQNIGDSEPETTASLEKCNFLPEQFLLPHALGPYRGGAAEQDGELLWGEAGGGPWQTVRTVSGAARRLLAHPGSCASCCFHAEIRLLTWSSASRKPCSSSLSRGSRPHCDGSQAPPAWLQGAGTWLTLTASSSNSPLFERHLPPSARCADPEPRGPSRSVSVKSVSETLKLSLPGPQVFHAFDEDKNGVIDKDELKTAMETLGATLTDAELAEMFEVRYLARQPWPAWPSEGLAPKPR